MSGDTVRLALEVVAVLPTCSLPLILDPYPGSRGREMVTRVTEETESTDGSPLSPTNLRKRQVRDKETTFVGGNPKSVVFRAMESSDGSSAHSFPIHCRPVHVENTPSPFSKESPEQNYRGFLNLTVLLLFVSMARLVLENFRKYGVLLSVPGAGISLHDALLGVTSLSLLWINALVAFSLECALVRSPSLYGGLLYRTLVIGNISGLLLAPTWIVWTHMYHPLLGFIVLFIPLVLSMKIISYHLVNAELRQLKVPGLYPQCPYPSNITLSNLLYFMLAPTLCYQPVYPRTERIRKKFLVKRLLELVACLGVIHLLTEQYALPTVQNSMRTISDLDWIGILERLLKLSVSSLYIWLVSFYALFHSFLNAFAEIIRFGDRAFYKAWWNATSIDEYWRLWNAPVHQWLKRHVYTPLVARKWSAQSARLVIFALSAAAHEFLIAVPTNVVQGWAFLGMMFQVPLIHITTWYMAKHPHSSFGNYFFWISFCILGQPMCVLLYYRAWISKNPSLSCSLFKYK